MRLARCYWYDANGRPFERTDGGLGCKYKGCSFAHPSDPDWGTATITGRIPPAHLLTDRQNEDFERETLARRRPPSPRRRPRSRTPPPRRRRSPSPRTTSSRPRIVRDKYDREREWGRRPREMERGRSADSISSTPPRPTTLLALPMSLAAQSSAGPSNRPANNASSAMNTSLPHPISAANSSTTVRAAETRDPRRRSPLRRESYSSVTSVNAPRILAKDATKESVARDGSRASITSGTAITLPGSEPPRPTVHERSETQRTGQALQGARTSSSSVDAKQGVPGTAENPTTTAITSLRENATPQLSLSLPPHVPPQSSVAPALPPPSRVSPIPMAVSPAAVPTSTSAPSIRPPFQSAKPEPVSSPLPAHPPRTSLPFSSPLPSPLPPPSAINVTRVPPVPGATPVQPSSSKDRVDAWNNLLQLIGRYNEVREQCTKLKCDLRTYVAMSNSVPDIQPRLQEVAAQQREKEAELEVLKAQLAEAEFVPVFKVARDPGEAAVREVRAWVAELRDEVTRLSAVVQEFGAGGSGAVGAQSKVREGGRPKKRLRQSADAMDVDTEGGRPRRSKASKASAETENLIRLVETFEQRLCDLENQLLQQEQDQLLEVDAIVQEKYDALKATLPPVASLLEAPEYRKEIEGIDGNMNVIGDQVSQLAEEVARMIFAQRTLEEENERLREDNRRLQETSELATARMSEMHREHTQNIELMRKELLAHDAAMSAYLSSRNPGPPHAAPPITTDALFNTLHPLLVQSVHTQIQPLLNDMQTQIREMLSAQERDLNTTLISKLTATMQAMQAIKVWADRIGLDGHAGATTSHGRSM